MMEWPRTAAGWEAYHRAEINKYRERVARRKRRWYNRFFRWLAKCIP
jgi:hypothetical protein